MLGAIIKLFINKTSILIEDSVSPIIRIEKLPLEKKLRVNSSEAVKIGVQSKLLLRSLLMLHGVYEVPDDLQP